MNIYIDDMAKDHIRNKSRDKSISIIMKKVGGGWCVSYEPSVQMGRPPNKDKFTVEKVDDIDVYILKGFKAKNNRLDIKLGKFLWIKTLNVVGILV